MTGMYDTPDATTGASAGATTGASTGASTGTAARTSTGTATGTLVVATTGASIGTASHADTLRAKEAEIEALRKKLEEQEARSRIKKLEDEKRRLEKLLEVPSLAATDRASDTAKRVEELKKKKEELEKKAAVSTAEALRITRATKEAELRTKMFGLDLCIVIDVTGSMGSWLDEAKAKVRSLLEGVTKFDPRATIRVAIVAYRDLCDGPAMRFVILDFTSDLNLVKTTLDPINATGGGDAPEDIAGALNEVTKLSWNNNNRLVVHIADAPCHGLDYHNYGTGGDNHSDGAFPDGKKPEDLLRTLCNKQINYYFVQITNATEKMTNIFSQVYESSDQAFKVHNLGTDASLLLPTILNSLRHTMSRSKAYAGSVTAPPEVITAFA